jgi:amidase
MTDDFAVLDATAQAELVRTGQVTPLELVDAAINRVEKLNGELNAVIHERFERARSEAAGPLPDGPFRGVPIVFKDLGCQMEGEPYQEGMQFLKQADYRPKHTDNLARKYRDAGFVCIGRTNTPELGLVPTTEPVAHGATHNPWKLAHTTGGSSGGSAAAVASGMVPVAHANDGGGSIRIPASCCGLVGLKPTRGRTSIGPELNEISSFLIAELCVSRTVRDTAAVLDAVNGPFPGDPTVAPPPTRPYRGEVGADPGRLRIGLLTENVIGDTPIHPDCVAAAEGTARLFESLGHVVERSHPGGFDDDELIMQFGAVWAAECGFILDDWGRKVGRAVTADDVEILTWALAETGRSVTAAQLVGAVHDAMQANRVAASWWSGTADDPGFDLLLTPTLGEPPVAHGTLDPRGALERLLPLRRVRALHRAVQRERPAGHQRPAALERRRSPHRGPARRRLRPRGPPAPGRVPARGGATLGRATSDRLRVMDEVAALDAVGQAELVRNGDVTPTELVTAAIERVEKLQPVVNALTTNRFERALEEAEVATRSPDAAPFRGVPFLVKDLACPFAGEPAHEGMRALKEAGYVAPITSHLARRWQEAGLIVLGRTNTPELGIMPTTEPAAYGPTRNPWNPDRSSGGSSGGSAAAVASGMVPAAHASDGGGSIRIPAACCGLVGLKTSRGRVSVGPHSGELARPLSVQFAVTRTVRDAAALLDVAAGPEPGDPMVAPAPSRPFRDEVGADPGSLRVGLMTTLPGSGEAVHPDCVAAAELAARLLESAGHRVDVAHPEAFDEPARMEAFIPIWSAMAASNLAVWGRALGRALGPDDVEPLTWKLAEHGLRVDAVAYQDALTAMQTFARRFLQWWSDGWDLLLTPTLGEPPPDLGVLNTPDEPFVGYGRAATFTPYTPVCNQSGQPAISLPLAQGSDGMPVGVHLVAAWGREDLLLRVAAQLEAAAPWADRRPTVHA